MTTFYNATQGVIEAANNAMPEIGDDCRLSSDERVVKIREIWEPIAKALLDAIPEDFEADEVTRRADFIGVTSDTRRPVFWGRDYGEFSEFVIG